MNGQVTGQLTSRMSKKEISKKPTSGKPQTSPLSPLEKSIARSRKRAEHGNETQEIEQRVSTGETKNPEAKRSVLKMAKARQEARDTDAPL